MDIRSYFKPVDKNGKAATPSQKTSKKKLVVISSDEEDVIDNSPALEQTKKSKFSNLLKTKGKKEDLKPAKVTDLFSTTPVKQSKVAEKSKSKNKSNEKQKREEAFQKTLDELDNNDLDDIDMVDLDRTIDETLKENPDATTAKVKITPSKTPSRKRKAEESLNESGLDPDQERYEKRRYSAALYQQYVNRPPPPHKGEKEMPEGTPDCLKNLCFMKTGVLDSLESEDLNAIVTKHGGRTVKALSKKVNYLVVGENPGPSKMEKARNFGTKEISEDEFLDMILVRSGKPPKYCKEDKQVADEGIPKTEPSTPTKEVTTSRKREKTHEKTPKKEEKTPQKGGKVSENLKEEETSKRDLRTPKKENAVKSKIESSSSRRESPRKKDSTQTSQMVKASPRKSSENKKEEAVSVRSSPRKQNASSSSKTDNQKSEKSKSPVRSSPRKRKGSPEQRKSPAKRRLNDEKSTIKPERLSMKIPESKPSATAPITLESSKSWTEKYKPTDLKTIIGQQDANSNMNKLKTWLLNWNRNHTGKNRPNLIRPSPWAKNDNGAFFKCALLSGPPGVGKTTTATLVAKELGYDIVEYNASDTRNKKLLHEEISSLLSSTSIASFFKDGSAPTKKHVLLMDEVDGMSGNQDRGGIQELISLIKDTNIPIICMCNDRQHQKIRSLGNYCFDLRFGKIKMEAIRGAMMSVCFKEGIKIKPDVLGQIITSTGNDIRQTLNHLSMWSAVDKNFSSEKITNETESSKKDPVLGPWEVIRKVFSADEHKTMSLGDKSKLFFYDYSIGPLFVQENYLQVKPHCSEKETLERVALAADAISMGDLIESKIRGSNNWSLMESQAFFSSVLPGHYMEGHFTGQINFPGWLGKNSKRTKFQRLANELQTHMRLSTSAGRVAVNLDYIYFLRDRIVNALKNNVVEEALQTMKDYNLLREDFDSLLELSGWSNKVDVMKDIESKVKAAFTRAYNKESPVLPYSINTTVSKKKTRSAVKDEDDIYGEEDEEESDNGDDDVANDAMIKEKKKTTSRAKKDDGASTSKKTTKGSTRGGRTKKK